MAFLDNSGDIILDAVLTDLGRKRLAEGNGTFKITKFALGDDEIDYTLYDKNHASGSAYYDLNILQAPVLEAFTNNMSSMKSRLLSYSDNDLLYLPVILANTNEQAFYTGLNSYIVLVDQATVAHFTTNNSNGAVNTLDDGIINGYEPANAAHYVVADQGLDTTELSANKTLNEYNSSLVETQYTIFIDNRLGDIRRPSTSTSGEFGYSSLDDDNIASYLVGDNDGSGIVFQPGTGGSVVRGPLGTRLQFRIGASLDLQSSTFLFNQLGTDGTTTITSGGEDLASGEYKYIDSTVRITGDNTGFTLDLPIRFVKKN